MAEKTVARPYARAVFEIASEAGQLDDWSLFLAVASETVADDGVRALLNSPHVSKDDLVGMILDVSREVGALRDAIATPAENFLRVLASNHRLGVLPEIAPLYESMKAEAENVVDVTLVSVSPVDKATQARFAAALTKKLGREVRLACEIDESLIGGAVVHADDLVIDGSVRGRLEKLTDAMTH